MKESTRDYRVGDVFFDAGGGLSSLSNFPTPSFPLPSLRPFKILVSSTIQILIQLRRRRVEPAARSSASLSRVPVFFFPATFSSRSPPRLPSPAKSEFNYDPSRSRFTPPSSHHDSWPISLSHLSTPVKTRTPFFSLSSSLASILVF